MASRSFGTLLCFTALAFFSLAKHASADIVAYFSFNSYNGIGSTINADISPSVLTLGQNGGPWSPAQLGVEPGTLINAAPGFTEGNALVLQHNGDESISRTMTFQLNTTGFENLQFSAALRGSNSAFNSAAISYSTNGTSYTSTNIVVDPSASGSFKLATADLSAFPILSNQSSFFIRLDLTGENVHAGQTISIDNIQFTASPASVPEPSTWGVMAATALLAAVVRRCRRSTKPRPLAPAQHLNTVA